MKHDSNAYSVRIARALRYIEAHLDRPLNLEELSREACFSPYHFHRIFTALVGESVAAYIRRLQLQRAAERLSYSTESVTIIALDAGYESADAFSRAFRSLFGLSPSAYRKQCGTKAIAFGRRVGTPFFYTQLVGVVPMEVIIKKFSPRFALSYRHVGAYSDSGPVWQKLCTKVGEQGFLSLEGILFLSISLDDPDITPAEKCRMDVCVSLPQGIGLEDPRVQAVLQDQDAHGFIVGGESDYASLLVKGPYTLLHPAYRSLFGEWFPQSGREPDDGPGYEIYHNSLEVTGPENLLTEILIPLRSLI